MIHQLSIALDRILNDPALNARFPELLAARIDFIRPPDNFTPDRPIVNLFLYDIRENLELRSNEPVVTRNGTQAVIERAPRRIDCSYLVTAWTNTTGESGALAEHQLLGQALEVLGGFPTIPARYLAEPVPLSRLQGQEPPLPMLAPHVNGLQSPAEFWSAMENQLRASFTVTATLSMPQFPSDTAPLVTSVNSGFDAGEELFDETLLQIGGRVLNQAGGPIGNAIIDVLDPRLRTKTDAEGRFTFRRIPPGKRDFRVTAVGFQPLPTTLPVPGPQESFQFSLTPL